MNKINLPLYDYENCIITNTDIIGSNMYNPIMFLDYVK
jgi:hypothetical protein